jgi:serine/threonine protein kinase
MAQADGRLIGGRYRLAAAIGQGNMGRVWHARDELLGRDVAIKEVLFLPGLSEAEKDDHRQRMLREARSAAQLSHPAVATVHDVVEDLGRPWIVMELVPGRSLDRVIAKDGPLPPKAVAQIGRQLLDALAAVHAVGVLHRDVKPSNVLLTGDGRAVLTDFGIATIDGDPSLTQAGMVVGTPAFTAPERIRGEAATPAADLWSLGATLYAAVEGQGPYNHHGSAPSIIAAIVTDDPPPPKTAGPLTGVITAFLSRDPAARPSAAAAMRMLEEAATAPAEAPSRRNPPDRRLRRMPWAVAAALACLVTALSVSLWELRPPASQASALVAPQSSLNPTVPPPSSAKPGKPIQRKASTAAHPDDRAAAPVPGPARVDVPADRTSPSSPPPSPSSAPPSPSPSSDPPSSAPPSSAPPPSNVDLALGRPVTATSYVQAYYPANVTDGDTSTYWEGASGVFPQSMTIDLGSVTDIAEIVLALPPVADWNSRVQTLAIYGSQTSASSAFTIVPAAGYTFDAETNNDEVTISFAPTATRYVTVDFTANSGWTAAQLAEISIYP